MAHSLQSADFPHLMYNVPCLINFKNGDIFYSNVTQVLLLVSDGVKYQVKVAVAFFFFSYL